MHPTLRRSAVPVLRKEALARTLGLFSAPALAQVLGIGFNGAIFNSRSNALCDPMIKKYLFGTDTNQRPRLLRLDPAVPAFRPIRSSDHRVCLWNSARGHSHPDSQDTARNTPDLGDR